MPANPHDELANFLRKHAKDPALVNDALAAIPAALAHAASPAAQAPAAIPGALARAAAGRISRRELAMQAKRLAKTAGEFANAFEFAFLRDSAEGKQMANELHFFLRHSANPDQLIWPTAGTLEFDLATRFIFESPMKLARALRVIEHNAKALVYKDTGSIKNRKLVLASRGRPSDDARRGLGIELAVMWEEVTGKRPTASGSASLDHPGTLFGTFVALIAKLEPLGHIITNRDLSRFLLDAVASWRRRVVK